MIATKKTENPPVTDPWVSPRWVADKYNVSYDTAWRWVRKLTRKYLTYTDDRFKREKRRHVMRRIPLSLLEEHINDLLN